MEGQVAAEAAVAAAVDLEGEAMDRATLVALLEEEARAAADKRATGGAPAESTVGWGAME